MGRTHEGQWIDDAQARLLPTTWATEAEAWAAHYEPIILTDA